MNKMKRTVFLTLPIFILIMFFYMGAVLFMPITFKDKEIEIHIPKGMTYKEVIHLLRENGILRGHYLFLCLGVLTGTDKKLKSGYYIFRSGTDPIEIFQKLLRGEMIEYEVTVIPGSTLWDVAPVLESHSFIANDEFFKLAHDKIFLDSLKIKAPSMEGYLFPDTYRFPKGTPPVKIIETMVNTLRKNYPSDFDTKAGRLGMNENQILTLASIIEKEARFDGERSVISAVFHNRLKKGLPLQSDPTSIYGIKGYREGVTSYDIRNDNPYNTYRINGLPPGPIATPSIKSIHAAMNPQDVSYLYFVSRKDGTHYFSETFPEHRDAILRYGKKQETK